MQNQKNVIKKTLFLIIISLGIYLINCEPASGIRLLITDNDNIANLLNIENSSKYKLVENNEIKGYIETIRSSVMENDKQIFNVNSYVYNDESSVNTTGKYDEKFKLIREETNIISENSEILLKSTLEGAYYKIALIRGDRYDEIEKYLVENEVVGLFYLMTGFGTYNTTGDSWVAIDFDTNINSFVNTRCYISGFEDIELFENTYNTTIIKTFEMQSLPSSLHLIPYMVSSFKPDIDWLEQAYNAAQNKSVMWIDNYGNILKGKITEENNISDIELIYLEEQKIK